MDQTVLNWLLEEQTPEVRLRTLKEYLKLSEDDTEAIRFSATTFLRPVSSPEAMAWR